MRGDAEDRFWDWFWPTVWGAVFAVGIGALLVIVTGFILAAIVSGVG